MKQITLGFLLIISFWICADIFSQAYVEQNSGVTSGLSSVSVIQNASYSSSSAWICGYNGVVLKTTNYGVNWLNKSGNGIPVDVDLYNIFGIDTATALTTGSTSSGTFVYRTSNGGNTWQQVITQPNGFMDAIWMKTPLIGFMYGDPVGGRWSLWRTSNGGINWDSAGMNLPAIGTEAGWNNALFIRNNYIWFGTNNHKIYFSSNFGLNWFSAPSAEANIYAIWYFYVDSLYAYYGGSNAFKTTNGGATWILTPCPGTGNFAGFVSGSAGVYEGSYPPMINWTVRSDNKIYEARETFNWIQGYTAPSGNYWHIGPDCKNQLMYTWAVRSNGGITRVTTAFGGVKIITSSVPESYSLSQNYPNPFNPVTKIKFSIPLSRVSEGRGVSVSLILYDVLGREIATLVNESLSPGTYEVQWDGTNYPSGVYFYKLISKEYSETKKMVLIK